MGYLKAPSNRMTSSFQDHKSRGTTGEDWGSNDGSTSKNDQFEYPCKNYKKVGTATFSDGTYCEYYNFTSDNGLKFSCRTCHCHDFKATGDDYLGSTGYHIHAQFCLGHKTEEWIQTNRNGSAFVPFAEIIEEDNKMTKTYKNYFKVIENFDETMRYYPEVASFKLECTVETPVYSDAKLTKAVSTPFKPGQKVISDWHSTVVKSGKEYHVHEIKDNQHGATCYLIYKKEI